MVACWIGLQPPSVSATEYCTCQAQRYSVYILASGSSCTQVTNNLLAGLHGQAYYNCHEALGYDDYCNDSVTLGSCYFSGGQYYRDGTIYYNCLACVIIDDP
jgi:hypothetical protein